MKDFSARRIVSYAERDEELTTYAAEDEGPYENGLDVEEEE